MDNIYKIWFSRIEISNQIKIKILNNFCEKEIWNMTQKELKEKFSDIDEKYLNRINEKNYKDNLEKYENYMEKRNIKLVSYKEKFYPKKLENIYDKPAYIYIRGNENLLDDDNVAIVRF